MTNDPHDAAGIRFACLGQAFSRFPPDLFDTQESAHAVSSSGTQNKKGCQPDQNVLDDAQGALPGEERFNAPAGRMRKDEQGNDGGQGKQVEEDPLVPGSLSYCPPNKIGKSCGNEGAVKSAVAHPKKRKQ